MNFQYYYQVASGKSNDNNDKTMLLLAKLIQWKSYLDSVLQYAPFFPSLYRVAWKKNIFSPTLLSLQITKWFSLSIHTTLLSTPQINIFNLFLITLEMAKSVYHFNLLRILWVLSAYLNSFNVIKSINPGDFASFVYFSSYH